MLESSKRKSGTDDVLIYPRESGKKLGIVIEGMMYHENLRKG
jgi:hypothetical protein